MSIIGSVFGKKPAAPNPIRETLFGDMPIDAWPKEGEPTDALPWGGFVSARIHLQSGNQADAIAWWRYILEQPGLEPRQYLQAWHFLRQHGQQPPPEVGKRVLGVVIEVAMPEGLDLLAAYPDHSARYYNYSGAGVVWEHPDDSLNHPIDQILAASQRIVDKIGPWDKERPTPPPMGQTRMSFLTPSGLHFGQAPMAALMGDPLAHGVIDWATALMKILIVKSQTAKR